MSAIRPCGRDGNLPNRYVKWSGPCPSVGWAAFPSSKVDATIRNFDTSEGPLMMSCHRSARIRRRCAELTACKGML